MNKPAQILHVSIHPKDLSTNFILGIVFGDLEKSQTQVIISRIEIIDLHF